TPEGRVSEVQMPVTEPSRPVGHSDPALQPTLHEESQPQGQLSPSDRPTEVERPLRPPDKGQPPVVLVVRRGGLIGKPLLLGLAAAGGVALGWAKIHPKSAERVRERLKEAGREVMEEGGKTVGRTAEEPRKASQAIIPDAQEKTVAAPPGEPDGGAG